MANDEKSNVAKTFWEAKEEFAMPTEKSLTTRSPQKPSRRETKQEQEKKKESFFSNFFSNQELSSQARQFRGVLLMAMALFILVSLIVFISNPAPQQAGKIVSILKDHVLIIPSENVTLKPNQKLDIIHQTKDQFQKIGIVQLDSVITAPLSAKVIARSDSLIMKARGSIVQTRRPLRLDYVLGRFLFWLVGIFAFIISLILAVWSILYFGNQFDKYAVKTALVASCIFTSFILFALIFPAINQGAGILGFGLLTFSESVIGRVGSLVVFSTILTLILLFILTEFNFVGFYEKLRYWKTQGFRKNTNETQTTPTQPQWKREQVIEDVEFKVEPFTPEAATVDLDDDFDDDNEPPPPKQSPPPPEKTESKKKKPSKTKKDIKQDPPPKPPPEETTAGEVENEEYVFPKSDFLEKAKKIDYSKQKSERERKGRVLEDKLHEFGIKGEITGVNPGPLITLYEFRPEPGVKISRIVNLADDLAMRMKAHPVRIIAPIPGKEAVGIEIPNQEWQTVYLRDVLSSREFSTLDSKLSVAIGMDVAGYPFVTDITDMPHLLVAGATGSGKSVFLNVLICSVLFQATPEDVQFLMIDPKRLEFSTYSGIPHLVAPVVTQPTEAVTALSWAVAQMEKRYKLLAVAGVRDINSYNRIVRSKTSSQYRLRFGDRNDEDQPSPLPYLLVIVDELADLMMTSAREIETYLARLAQMARAVGIHLIIATQRPSVDVITGTIKANFPSRIAFQVASKIDSRTILDMNGAEQLLGHGDMLFLPAWRGKPFRLHGSFVSTSQVQKLVKKIIENNPSWIHDKKISFQEMTQKTDVTNIWSAKDEKYLEAMQIVIKEQQASVSFLQRKLGVGYARAGRILDLLEEDGIVGPNNGSRSREVTVDQNYLLDMGIVESDLAT